MKPAWILAVGLILSHCGKKEEEQSYLKEQMNAYNKPARVSGALGPLSYRLEDLPKAGQVTGVWTGNWWPIRMGGVAGPLRKLDQVTNRQGLAYNWELQSIARQRHLPWAGHCNGLAAAGTMTQMPRHGVNYRGVNFTVEDIKGLLIEAWQGGGEIVGARCYNAPYLLDLRGRAVDERCRDLNPGAFHIVLSNFLGRFHLPVIIDISADIQVWNYPVVNFQVQSQRELALAEALRLLGEAGRGTYPFNPKASRFIEVKTRIQLATGRVFIYHYLLEGNDQGDIIGGEWLGLSRTTHPDFIWRHVRPQAENPHVDIKTVYEIYELSLQ